MTAAIFDHRPHGRGWGEASGGRQSPGSVEKRAAEALLRNFGLTFGALALVAFPVVAHTVSPVLAIASLVALMTLSYVLSPSLALTAVLFGGLFQNFFVSLVSPLLSAGTEFDIVRGYNFQILMMVWGLAVLDYLYHWRRDDHETNRLIYWTSAALALIVVYLLLGALEAPIPAFIYLRNVGAGLFTFQAFLIVARRYRLSMGTAIAGGAMVIAVLGYIELIYRDQWLIWTNGHAFWTLARDDEIVAGLWDKQAAQTGHVVLGLVDSFRTTFLNTPLLQDLDLQMLRLFGPNMHPISYAYALSFLTIFALFTGRYGLAVVLAPLLFCANAKGALICVLLTTFSYGVSRLLGMKTAFWTLVLGLICYVILGIIVGLRIGDFHVLGLMGGIYNFLDYPIGHGLGAGGNLAVDFSEFNWSEFQAAGRTPIAVESSIGVLLFQMGVAAFGVLACYVWMSKTSLAYSARTGISLNVAAAFALLVTTVNGFFQEEALFSPLGIGLWLALNGLVMGAVIRERGAE